MTYTLITILVPILLVVIDQGIKAWATAQLLPVGSMPLIPGVVELRYLLNDGAAFSSMAGKQTFLIAFTSVMLVLLLGYLLFKRPQDKLEYAGWVLILGGGIGNLIDRALNNVVVDYINLLFMNFAVFNFADICVCTGVGFYILALVLQEVKKRKTDGAA